MTKIKLKNENGELVGYDVDTGNKVPIGIESLETTSEIVDPAGVSHTGELADLADAGGSISVEDDGALVLSAASTFDFTTELDATDAGSGEVTISLSDILTGIQIGELTTRNPGYFSDLDANSSFTDPAGVSHTGELADDGDTQPPESHGNADHSQNMVEDATTTGNAPYEIQKNGTDGTGVINFKT